MKLKKRIKMFEDFASTADTSNSTAPVSKTTDTSIAVDKTNTKSGEAIRTEVIKDVDTILNNLAELSNQITEEVDQIVEAFYTEFEMVNEASFVEKMMAQIKAIKNFATLKAAYPAKRKSIAEAEVDKTSVLAEFDSTSGEKTEEAIKALKDKWNEKLNQAKEKFADNPAKKNAALAKLREMRDEAVKSAETGSIKAKVDAKRQQLAAGEDNKIADLKNELAEFEKKFAITDAETLTAQWTKAKADIDTEISQWQIEANVEAQTQFSDDPEAMEKAKAKAEQKLADEAKEAKVRAKELEDDLKAAEAKLAEQEAEAMNDPDKKEAIVAVKNFYAAGQKYIGILSSASEEITDEEKKTINATKKELSAAKKELTAGKLVKAGEAENNEEAEQLIAGLGDAVDQAVEQYSAKIAKADAAKKAQETEIKNKITKAKEEVKDLEGDVETADDKKAAKEAVLRKKIEVETLNKELAISQDKDPAKYDSNIQSLEQEIANLSSGGGEDQSQSASDAANEFIANNPDFKVVENPDEEVSYTENGEERTMKKWTDVREIKGKDADGNEVADDVVKVGKEAEVPENSSAQTQTGDNVSEEEAVCEKCGEVHEGECATDEAVTESFAFKSGSVADRFRSLM